MSNKKKKTAIAMIVIGAVMVLIGLGYRFVLPSEPVQTGTGLTLDTNQAESDGEITEKKDSKPPTFIATGYYDMDLAQGEQIYLVNDAENETEDYTVMLQYLLTDATTGEAIFETGLIEPGKASPFTASDYLDEGSNRVSIKEQPYVMENGDWIPKFAAAQEITINIGAK